MGGGALEAKERFFCTFLDAGERSVLGAVITGNSEEYCTKTVRRSFPDKFNQGK